MHRADGISRPLRRSMCCSIISATSTSVIRQSAQRSGGGNSRGFSSPSVLALVKTCMSTKGTLRTHVIAPPRSRACGMSETALPTTLLITFICGSHGSSGSGARICGRGSCRCSARHACSPWRPRRLLLLRRLQDGFDRVQAGAGKLVRLPPQRLGLDRIDVGIDHARGERRHHRLLGNLRERRPDALGVVSQLVEGAAVRERMNERLATGPAHDLGLAPPIRQPSIGSAKVAPSNRSGSAKMSPTVQPVSSSSSNSSTTSGSNTPSHQRSTVLRAVGSGLPRAIRRLTSTATNSSRTRAISGRSRAFSLAVRSSNRACSTMLSGGQAAIVSSTAPWTATGRRLPCCNGGLSFGGPSNTNRSLARPYGRQSNAP